MILLNTSPTMLDDMLVSEIAALSIEELAKLQAQIKSDADLSKNRKEKLQEALIFKCGPAEKEQRRADQDTLGADGFSGVCSVPIENKVVKITRSMNIKCDQIDIIALINNCPDVKSAQRIITPKYSVSKLYWNGATKKVTDHLSAAITFSTSSPVFDLSKVGEK